MKNVKHRIGTKQAGYDILGSHDGVAVVSCLLRCDGEGSECLEGSYWLQNVCNHFSSDTVTSWMSESLENMC
jgi:hypothetical protein